MTTSYKLEAQKKLKAEKKQLREQEAMELKQQQEAEDKAHQENMARIKKKIAIINGEAPVEEKKVVKTTTAVKKTTVKKPESGFNESLVVLFAEILINIMLPSWNANSYDVPLSDCQLVTKAPTPVPVTYCVKIVEASPNCTVSIKVPAVILAAPTGLAGIASLFQTVPVDVKTCPSAPGATEVIADVPAPTRTLFAVCVDAPVPPCATATSVPSQVPVATVPRVAIDA